MGLPIRLSAALLTLFCVGCSREKERVVAKDPRGAGVLEYVHEIAGGENAREEFQLRARGQSKRVYGPAKAGATALHTVAWGPDSVYVLRCSATEAPLFLGWRLSDLRELPKDAAVRGVYQSLPPLFRTQTFVQLCSTAPKLPAPTAPGQPGVFPSHRLQTD